jgi:hypothetical protein
MKADDDIVFQDELARLLGTDVDSIYEMAHQGQLPFAVSMASPRRLFVQRRDVPSWQLARGRQ